MPKYYAVKDGRSTGIYGSWDECKTQTNGYSNAKFKSFNTREEANHYMSGSGQSSTPASGGYSYGRSSTRSGQSSSRSSVGYSYDGSSSGQQQASGRLRVYTDGSCPHNGYDGARAGIGIHFPDNPRLDISEPLPGRQTNNRAEITAATRAIQEAKKMGYTGVEINTDSNFLKQSAEEWVPNWKRNGWKKSDGSPVINKEDFIELETASRGMDVKWNKVPAHSGIAGNEIADRLANEGAAKY